MPALQQQAFPSTLHHCWKISHSPPSVTSAGGMLVTKNIKKIYRWFITEFLTQAAIIDNTVTVFKFFSTDRTPPRFPTFPLQTPFQLLMDLGNLRYYFPGRAPEAPSNTAVMMYIGHTTEFATLSARAEAWLKARNATWAATTIQSEHAKDLCWFVYSTKNTNCNDLGAALSKLLGKTVGLQFKTIQKGPPNKPTASMVHLLADKADTNQIMKQLNNIYREERMNNQAADYPLGQWLLLAPMAKGLNDNNMATLLQLKTKQASFCNQIIMVTIWVVGRGRKPLLVPMRLTDAGGTPNKRHMCILPGNQQLFHRTRRRLHHAPKHSEPWSQCSTWAYSIHKVVIGASLWKKAIIQPGSHLPPWGTSRNDISNLGREE